MFSNNTPQNPPRTSPKTTSFRNNSQQWKEDLRKECVERAKSARRERLRRQRANSNAEGNIHINYSGLNGARGMKRDREEHVSELNNHDNNDKNHSDSMINDLLYHGEDDSMQTARELVEQELQKSMMGLRHCHQLYPLNDTENASKRTMRFGADEMMDVYHLDADDEECKMSQEEYLELVNAVTEELEREGA